jgi:hypothetical protein
MIFGGLAFLAVVSFGSFPTLFRQLALPATQRKTEYKRKNLLTGEGGGGGGGAKSCDRKKA